MEPSEIRDGVEQREKPRSTSPSTRAACADFVLVNPRAGGGRTAAIVPQLRKFAQERNWYVELCATDSAQDLAAKARCAAEKGHRRIFVLGGDGTFQVLLNALHDYPSVVLGIIPAGGGNDLAAALGFSADPLRAVSQLLHHSQVCRMDAVRARTADGRERLYTGGGGVGIDAEASRYASGTYRNLRGRVRYLLSALRALRGFHSLAATILMGPDEPRHMETNALLIAVLNTPSYGAGIYLAPDASPTDGILDLVILEDRSIFETLRLLPSLWSTGRLPTDHIQRFRVSGARIETTTPGYFHGDGEILGMTPVEISVVPQAFSILRAAGER